MVLFGVLLCCSYGGSLSLLICYPVRILTKIKLSDLINLFLYQSFDNSYGLNVKKLTDHKTKSILSYLYIELEIVRYKIALLKKYNMH